MAGSPRNNAAKTRGRPFEKGNVGRPKGARHKATVAAEALLDGEAEALTRKAVELALEGDVPTLRLCLERILPPRKDRPLSFSLPAVKAADDVADAQAAVVAAMAAGELTPGEAEAISSVVEARRRAIETTEIEARLTALERPSGVTK